MTFCRPPTGKPDSRAHPTDGAGDRHGGAG
jgi:hypothetical protein